MFYKNDLVTIKKQLRIRLLYIQEQIKGLEFFQGVLDDFKPKTITKRLNTACKAKSDNYYIGIQKDFSFTVSLYMDNSNDELKNYIIDRKIMICFINDNEINEIDQLKNQIKKQIEYLKIFIDDFVRDTNNIDDIYNTYNQLHKDIDQMQNSTNMYIWDALGKNNCSINSYN